MKVTLVNEELKTRKEFTQNEIVIGRDNNCDFTTPPEDMITSRHHCLIIQDKKSIFIKDTSKNGTTVGKLELKKDKTAPLTNGDMIFVGKSTLKVLIEGEGEEIKLAPADQTVSEVQEVPLKAEDYVAPKDNDEVQLEIDEGEEKDEFSDSSPGISDEAVKEGSGDLGELKIVKEDSPMPTGAELEKDLAKIDEQQKTGQ